MDKKGVFMEVAPGHGDLLRLLADKVNFIYSIDPSPTSSYMQNLSNALHICGFFDVELVRANLKHKVDCIIFRHLLEHIHTPREFLESVVAILEENGMLYIEVPNIDELFLHNKFYELYHDHFGYPSKNVLINLMSVLGCEFVDEFYLYDANWMGLFFRKNKNAKKQNLKVKFYTKEEISTLNESVEKLNALLKPYENVAIYGGDIDANMLFNFIDDKRKIKCALDINPEKIGRFLCNSDVIIKEPKPLNLQNIDAILMSTALFEERIVKEEIFPMVNQGLCVGAYPYCEKIA